MRLSTGSLRLDSKENDFRRYAEADRDDTRADPRGDEEVMVVFKVVPTNVAVC